MDWPRLWWTLALAALCVVLAGLLWWGWRNRRRRQSTFPALPVRPAGRQTPLAEPITGLYVSTVYSGQWQNRIVAAGVGRRAKATLHLTADGIEIERVGEDPIWIPTAVVREVGTAPGTAGKVMVTPDGILLISWLWGDTLVASGIRGDDLHAQVPWIDAARQLTASSAGAGSDQNKTDENPNGVTP